MHIFAEYRLQRGVHGWKTTDCGCVPGELCVADQQLCESCHLHDVEQVSFNET